MLPRRSPSLLTEHHGASHRSRTGSRGPPRSGSSGLQTARHQAPPDASGIGRKRLRDRRDARRRVSPRFDRARSARAVASRSSKPCARRYPSAGPWPQRWQAGLAGGEETSARAGRAGGEAARFNGEPGITGSELGHVEAERPADQRALPCLGCRARQRTVAGTAVSQAPAGPVPDNRSAWPSPTATST